jgi:hypothetical protein
VSPQIGQGEVVGLIGRNGAGKSTLLKIISRITEPTEGRLRIRGRAASLLEVGTGFHPELTGRENIFLNRAILGMPKTEIRAKFDQIVAFAEVAQFLDTPVKRYSSGMYVRLAFSIAAHLEPDILIVDEVLAVGDAVSEKAPGANVGSRGNGPDDSVRQPQPGPREIHVPSRHPAGAWTGRLRRPRRGDSRAIPRRSRGRGLIQLARASAPAWHRNRAPLPRWHQGCQSRDHKQCRGRPGFAIRLSYDQAAARFDLLFHHLRCRRAGCHLL